MSACASPTPQSEYASIPQQTQTRTLFLDVDAPPNVRLPVTPPEAAAVNRGIMAASEALGRRIRLRFECECRVRWRNSYTYKRLRCAAPLYDAPSIEQAELFLAAVHEFMASLSGKWLAPKPLETSEQSAVDPQANSVSPR